jgi:hypothetical protein
MPTTRQRVNLTLTEREQRLLEAIVTEGTSEHEFLVRHLQSQYGSPGGTPGGTPALGLADVVHVVLKLGLERLEAESAEISYAAEASAATEADRAVTAALRRRHVASAARAGG